MSLHQKRRGFKPGVGAALALAVFAVLLLLNLQLQLAVMFVLFGLLIAPLSLIPRRSDQRRLILAMTSLSLLMGGLLGASHYINSRQSSMADFEIRSDFDPQPTKLYKLRFNEVGEHDRLTIPQGDEE